MKLFENKRPFIIFFIILIVLLFLFVVKAYYDTNCIEVKYYEIKNSSLGRRLSGLKVGHLSDLHIKEIGVKEDKILKVLKMEKPDLIFITGDLIGFGGPYESAISFLHQLKPPYGIYGVLGNTEYSNENGSCVLCHEEKSRSLKKEPNPVFLKNSSITLRINGRTVNLIGVDDPVSKKSDLRVAIQKIDEEAPSILLAHSPEIFEETSRFKIDLILSGHTHGGQTFFTKYFKKIFPLDASLQFIEGFFQQGKTLMYVSSGVGTSILPFRLGIKPEITFFTFSNNPTDSPNLLNPGDLINIFSISNKSPKTFFAGLSLSPLLETFNFLNIFDSLVLKTSRYKDSRQNNLSKPTNQNSANNSIHTSNPSYSSDSISLFDFESEEELRRLNWECQKWFELSKKNVTSGKYSLHVVLPPGVYPGINFAERRRDWFDWSGFHYLKMDIFNPSEERVNLCIRIDDNESGLEYANRFDTVFELKQGMNQVVIPTNSIRTNTHRRPLNLKQIKRIIVFIMNNKKQRELYMDNFRLDNRYNN